MLALSRNVYEYRELCASLVRREIASRYAQSLLGPAWAIAQPAALLAAFVLLAKFVNVPSNGAPYPLFAAVGLAPWTIFTTALGAAAPTLVLNASIIKKVYFPREVLPVSGAIASAVDAAVTLAMLALVMALYGVAPTVWILLVPVLIAIIVALALAAGLIIAAISAFYRDLLIGAAFLLQLAVYTCPVIYSIDSVPESMRGLYLANPLAAVITAFRACILGPHAPDLRGVAVAAAEAAIALVVAHLIFKRLEPSFADYV